MKNEIIFLGNYIGGYLPMKRVEKIVDSLFNNTIPSDGHLDIPNIGWGCAIELNIMTLKIIQEFTKDMEYCETISSNILKYKNDNDFCFPQLRMICDNTQFKIAIEEYFNDVVWTDKEIHMSDVICDEPVYQDISRDDMVRLIQKIISYDIKIYDQYGDAL